MNSNILDLTENEHAFIRFRYPHIDPDDLLSYAPGMQTLRNIDILETLVRYKTSYSKEIEIRWRLWWWCRFSKYQESFGKNQTVISQQAPHSRQHSSAVNDWIKLIQPLQTKIAQSQTETDWLQQLILSFSISAILLLYRTPVEGSGNWKLMRYGTYIQKKQIFYLAIHRRHWSHL